MNLLREYIRGQLVVIPPPPDVETRVKELEYIIKRREKPVTSPEYSDILDRGIPHIFEQILSTAGVSGSLEAIDALKDEIKPEIYFHKKHFGEPRPNELAEVLGISFDYDYLESAQTPSYPSGHTAQAFYIAYCLSAKFPDLRHLFLRAAELIAESRIDRGVHFPSDNEAGKLLAYELFKRRAL